MARLLNTLRVLVWSHIDIQAIADGAPCLPHSAATRTAAAHANPSLNQVYRVAPSGIVDDGQLQAVSELTRCRAGGLRDKPNHGQS
jgi:hypothetical protein